MTRTKYRFWSDTDEANFEDGVAALGLWVPIVGHVAEVPAEATSIAIDCNAALMQDEAPTTSGVDGLQDTEAFSVRSDAAKMPYYEPPAVTTVFYKKTERRRTRGQP
jgi:hypothetical protein